jgi:hypothetical protein
MKVEDAVKLFGMTNQLIETDLDAVEKRFSIDLGRNSSDGSILRDEDYFPQFEERVRKEAATSRFSIVWRIRCGRQFKKS